VNGFYPMLNDVHDKAVKDLPLAECALFEHIWRKLIGWNKWEDEISISQLVEETAACRASIMHIIKKLEEKRWIVVTRQTSVTNRNFTSKIAIPACPGIKSRLGWSTIHTTPSIESIPGGGIESIHTTDSSSTDNLQTSSTEDETEMFKWLLKEFQNVVPGTGWRPNTNSERERFNELCKAPKERLTEILTKARQEGVSSRGLLKWTEGGLKDFGRLYRDAGGNGGSTLPSRAECEEQIALLTKDYEFQMDAPESDFTERRILRENVLSDIDGKIAYYEGVMKGE